MILYPSGTPSNDHYQVIENQMCSHRLFSMYRPNQPAVMKWLEPLRRKILTFGDYRLDNKQALRVLAHKDDLMRERLRERNISEEWRPYAETLSEVSRELPPAYPSSILLDSGAFSAWRDGKKTVTIDDVKRGYGEFLEKGEGLFDAVWLINLDKITDAKTSAAERREAIRISDRNFKALSAEFGNRVLPVFHQGEGPHRFLDVIDQAQGYLCLSPNNDLPEPVRCDWAWLTRAAMRCLDCSVLTHGLATTGNEMVREAGFYSGDSASWKLHVGFGLVDLLRDEPSFERHLTIREDRSIEEKGLTERKRLRYQGYHSARERNDFDRYQRIELPNSPRHYTHLPPDEQKWVRNQVERTVPFLLAQFDKQARELVNISEMRSFADSFEWQPGGGSLFNVNGKPPQRGSALYRELRPYPTAEDRAWFLADKRFADL